MLVLHLQVLPADLTVVDLVHSLPPAAISPTIRLLAIDCHSRDGCWQCIVRLGCTRTLHAIHQLSLQFLATQLSQPALAVCCALLFSHLGQLVLSVSDLSASLAVSVPLCFLLGLLPIDLQQGTA